MSFNPTKTTKITSNNEPTIFVVLLFVIFVVLVILRYFLYTLRLGSGAEVLCLTPSHHDHPTGSKLGIRLEIDHLVIFPAKP